MLYLKCPTCKELLGNKQLIYEAELKKICDKYTDINDTRYENEKSDLIKKIGVKRYCCRMRIISYVRLIDVIK